MKLHPEEMTISLIDVTFAALMSGAGTECDLRHHVIRFDEAVEGRKQDAKLMALLRELTTKEQVQRCKMVGGDAVVLTLFGPTTVIDTMLTDTKMSIQDASRYVVTVVKNDRDTRNAISNLAVERFTSTGLRRRASFEQTTEAHRSFLLDLRADLTVVLPSWFRLPEINVRFNASVCSLICTHAWLNQGNRVISEDAKTIEATLEDYQQVWSLLRNVQILTPDDLLNESSKSILRAWQQHARKVGNSAVKRSELQDVVAPSMHPSAFSRILQGICRAGFAFVARKLARGENAYRLTPAGKKDVGCDWVAQLPTPEMLRRDAA